MAVVTTLAKTTSWKAVLPFYLYAAVCFLLATLLLAFSVPAFKQHYFHPQTLAITHLMALGWGTMMILGASHQLVPVLVERELYSVKLAMATFLLSATGIPLLIYGFYAFNIGWPAQSGGILVVVAILLYLVNLALTISNSKQENVQAYFVFTATIWLFATAVFGLMLLFNFTRAILPAGSLRYLPLHAHMGIVGWFVLLIIGIGSKLLPMFLLSKYNKPKILWCIYALMNAGLLLFVFLFLYTEQRILLWFPLFTIAAALILFGNYCYHCYRQRLRKKMDQQMSLSFASVLMMLLPVAGAIVMLVLLLKSTIESSRLILAYGFVVFFGWITALILGMTFKTLPFIIWNKCYSSLAGKSGIPNPKDLFSGFIFSWMRRLYLAGFILFGAGIICGCQLLLLPASFLLVASSVLYTLNVLKLLLHKPVIL